HFGHIRSDRLRSLVYSAADLFVIPSIQENFPLTVLEALACGIPVIGFAVGGIPESVRPGITGLLVPPRDVGALRNAIRDLLQASERRAQMAVDCRRIAVEEYALETYVQRYIKLYQTMLGSH